MLEPSPIRPISRRSLSDEIVDQLVERIASGSLKPGDRLPAERDLCRQLGVGRTSLREALKSLAVMGVIEGRVGEGTFVSLDSARYLEKSLQFGLLLDRKSIDDLVEVRVMLETQTAAAAAERARPEDVEELREAVDALAESLGDRNAFLHADLRFHVGIAAASQNTLLASMLQLTRNSLQQWIERSLADPSSPAGQSRARLSLEEHRAIHGAIASGDVEGARNAMRAHILSSSRDLPAGE